MNDTALYSGTAQTSPQALAPAEGRDGALRIIPLGGVGEFGANMMVYEYGDERIVVDCGSMIPEADMPGVDLIIPDIQALREGPARLTGIVLTHGHDDHIAALPYLLDELDVPVHATRLTLALLEPKLAEQELRHKPRLERMHYRRPVRLGRHFEVTPLSVTHSIPDSAALVIRCPAGNVLHTGDYKVDYNPVSGEQMDFHGLTRLNEEGLLALVGDSTNAEMPGATRDEHWVEQNLAPIFASARGSIIASTFSTSIHRIQVLMDLAIRHDRQVFVIGRSMERNISIASDLGFLHLPEAHLCAPGEYRDVPPDKRFVLASGTQGEPLSALTRLALGTHKKIEVQPGDTVILSARVIPGNARKIDRLINHFYRRGARVYDSQTAPVHASGHCYSEEMKMLLSLTRPRFVVPMHGSMRQLMRHRELALEMGYPERDVPILTNGDVLEIQDGLARKHKRLEAGHVLVDGKTVGETGEVVLRDRKHLSADGMIIAILNIDGTTGRLLGPPEIVTRGFVYVDENEQQIAELSEVARRAFEACAPETREEADVVNTEVRRALRRHIKKASQRFPLILPVVQEI